MVALLTKINTDRRGLGRVQWYGSIIAPWDSNVPVELNLYRLLVDVRVHMSNQSNPKERFRPAPADPLSSPQTHLEISPEFVSL